MSPDTPPIGPTPLGTHPVNCGFNYLFWGDAAHDTTNQAFLDKARMRDWARVIGPGAQPVQKNVIDISRFRRGATDQRMLEFEQ